MSDKALATFKSHIDGKNADVAIYRDRIEWARAGRLTATRATAKVATLGVASARKRGSTEMIPVRSIDSVVSQRDGFRHTMVQVRTAANTVELRVPHGRADDVRDLLNQLVLGRDVQALGDLGHDEVDEPAAPSSPPPPPPPSVPAGWNPDPHGRAELRYWDGARWTEHVSTGGVQAVDPA